MTKLNFGSGGDYRKDFINLDYDNADIKHNINDLPLPFKDNQFDFILNNNTLNYFRGDYIQLMNELYRIMKVGGRIEISLSHFSFYGAYGFKERAFALNSFKIFCDKDNQIYIPNCIVKDRPMFKVISKELSYQRTHNGKLLVKKNFYYYFGRVISYLANLNTHFCERVWCYWVGGFQEMKIVLEKL